MALEPFSFPFHLAYKGPRQLAATWCDISSHPLPMSGLTVEQHQWLEKVGCLLSLRWCHFPLLSVAVSGWHRPLGSPAGMCTPAVLCHRNSQTNETSGDFNISRWLSESVRVYTVVTVLYFSYFSVISMQSLTFLNIWFSTKEAKEVPAMRKYFQWGLKILPWKFACSNTVCFSGTFQWLWS